MPSTATDRSLLGLLYAGFAWFILLFVVIPVAAGCLLLPGLERRRRMARWGASTVLKLIGSGVEIRGEPPAGDDGAIVVANHQSYLDGIILTAVLPPQYTFLIKSEMRRVPVASFVLGRLGSEFVDRSDTNQRLRSARRLVRTARQGRALAVFPEGTFDSRPGLKPFRMGAFRAARLGGLCVIPVVITGSRSKLPADSWLPRPGPLCIEFCPRLSASDHADEAALMHAVRSAMIERLDEPDLEGVGGESTARERHPAEARG